MKQRDRFTFLRSYYEMFKHLKTKKDQALFINSILSAQFSCTKLEVLPEFSPSLQMALEAVSYQINSSIEGYTKHTEVLTPKQTPKPTPKATPKKKEIEIEIEKEIKLNQKAFKEWCEYKGAKFKAVSKTKAINILIEHDKPTQRKMIDASIANGWAGLFPIKQQSQFKSKNDAPPGSLNWQMEQEKLKAEGVDYVDVQIENC